MLDHELGCHIAGNGGPRRKAYDLLGGLRIFRGKGEVGLGGATRRIGDQYFQDARRIGPCGGRDSKCACGEIAVTVTGGPAAGCSIKSAGIIDIATCGIVLFHWLVCRPR